MLAKINWTFFVKPEMYDESLKNLVTCVRGDVDQAAATSPRDVTDDDDFIDDDYSGRNEHVSHAPMGTYGKHTSDPLIYYI